jgi:hypothetical protein
MSSAPDYPSNQTARYLASMAFVVAAVLLGGLALACAVQDANQQRHEWHRDYIGGP